MMGDGRLALYWYQLYVHFLFTGKRAYLYKKDDPDWVPSLNMEVQTRCKKRKPVGQGTDDIEYTSPEAERYSRRHRKKKKHDYSAAETLLLLNQVNPLAESIDTEDYNSKETQTSMTGDMIDSMQLELQTLRTENIELRS